jgi:hypothetical protein
MINSNKTGGVILNNEKKALIIIDVQKALYLAAFS